MLHWASEVILFFIHDWSFVFILVLALLIAIKIKEEINDLEKEYTGPMDNDGTDNSLPRSPILLHPEAHN